MPSGCDTVAHRSSVYRFSIDNRHEIQSCALTCSKINYDRCLGKWSSATAPNPLIIAQQHLQLFDVKCCFSRILQDYSIYCAVGYYSGTLLHLYLCWITDDNCYSDTIDLLSEAHQSLLDARSNHIDVWIIDDETVLVLADKTVYVALVDAKKSDRLSLRKVHLGDIDHIFCVTAKVDGNGSSPIAVESHASSKVFACLSARKTFISIFASISSNGGNKVMPKSLTCWTFDAAGKIIDENKDYVPQCYCDKIAGATFVDTTTQDQTKATKKHDIIILTSEYQLILWHGNNIKSAEQLHRSGACSSYKLEYTSSIEFLPFYTLPSDGKIVLHIKNTKFVYVISSNKLLVNRTYSNVEFIAVDDYAESGSQQLLVSQESLTASSSGLQSFVISDEDGKIIVDTISDTEMEEPNNVSEAHAKSSLLSVSEALRSRNQLGTESLAKQEGHIKVKESFIMKTCRNLNQWMCPKENLLGQVSSGLMVDMFGGNKVILAKQSKQILNNSLCVRKVWHVMASPDLIIGTNIDCTKDVEIVNTRMQLKDLHGSFDEYDTTCEFKLVCSANKVDEPAAKKRELSSPCVPRKHFKSGDCILCIAKIPLKTVNHHTLQCSIFLDWEASSSPLNHRQFFHCGALTLSAAKIIHCKSITEQETASNYISALDMCQVKTSLIVKSVHHGELYGLVDECLQSVGFEETGVRGSFIYTNTGPLQYTRCQITGKAYCALMLDVWVRDSHQFSLTIHACYAALPNDVLITPNTSTDQAAKSVAMDKTTREILIARDSVQELLMEPNDSVDCTDSRDYGTGSIGGIKKFFPEKRRLSHHNVEMNREKYRLFRKLNGEIAVETNAAVLKMIMH